MSYLAGPLTRRQIKRLVGPPPAAASGESPAAAPTANVVDDLAASPPLLPPGVPNRYLPINQSGDGEIVYGSRVLAAVDVAYHSARYNVNEDRYWLLQVELGEDPNALDFDQAADTGLSLEDLETEPDPDGKFMPLTGINATAVKKWQSRLKRWLRTERPMVLWKSATLRATSLPGESEGDFRARLQQLGNQLRDQKVEKLKARYEGKTKTLNDRLMRARQAVERESQQVSKRKLDTAISVGSAILGAVLGRRVSRTSASKIGTAVKGYGGVRKEAGDVERAKQRVAKLEADLNNLAEQFESQVDQLDDAYDAQEDALKELPIRAKNADIEVRFLGVGYLPHWRSEAETSLTAAFVAVLDEQ